MDKPRILRACRRLKHKSPIGFKLLLLRLQDECKKADEETG